MNAISRLLLGGTLDREVLLGAERSTLMLVDNPLRQYSSFFMRLLAATVVATAGIASDSATTIIGAMLIAPLMSPMLGTALATAMGRPRQALRTLALVIVGMVLVVVASACVTALIPVAADMETNSQVLCRVSPRLVDLIIALAAGFMAALASMRADIPDAVPGVAISASIVPPLCVVGAGLLEGAPDAAAGAFMLFLTNFLAIQVMGGAVYLLMGLGARHLSQVGAQARQIWYAFVALAMLVVVGLLFSTSMDVLDVAQRERQVQDVTSAWLDETGYRVEGLEVDGEDVYVRIVGSGEVPDARHLSDDLAEKNVGVESVSVSVLEEQRVTSGK